MTTIYGILPSAGIVRWIVSLGRISCHQECRNTSLNHSCICRQSIRRAIDAIASGFTFGNALAGSKVTKKLVTILEIRASAPRLLQGPP